MNSSKHLILKSFVFLKQLLYNIVYTFQKFKYELYFTLLMAYKIRKISNKHDYIKLKINFARPSSKEQWIKLLKKNKLLKKEFDWKETLMYLIIIGALYYGTSKTGKEKTRRFCRIGKNKADLRMHYFQTKWSILTSLISISENKKLPDPTFLLIKLLFEKLQRMSFLG